jgi:hypothetical protein
MRRPHRNPQPFAILVSLILVGGSAVLAAQTPPAQLATASQPTAVAVSDASINARSEALPPARPTRAPAGLVALSDEHARVLLAAIIGLSSSGAGPFPLLPR